LHIIVIRLQEVVHWLLRVHADPVACGLTHAIELLHQKPVAQDASPIASLLGHDVAHATALAHAKLPVHAVAAPPGLHVPSPLQVPAGVSIAFAQDAGHGALTPGNSHTPPTPHPVAPHAPAVGVHASVQQLPVPVTPHRPLVHSSSPAHAAPPPPCAAQVPPVAQ
jgi:hypothetical protein